MTVDRLCYHAQPPVQLYVIVIEDEFGRRWVDKETLGERQVQMCQHHLGLRQWQEEVLFGKMDKSWYPDMVGGLTKVFTFCIPCVTFIVYVFLITNLQIS